jgi:voltage-gated potassium channel
MEQFISMLKLLVFIDTFICFIFIMEAAYFLGRAKSKKEYFKRYYLDFLSSIPLLFLIWIWPQLLFLSFFKILRGIKSIAKIYDFMDENGKSRKKLNLEIQGESNKKA